MSRDNLKLVAVAAFCLIAGWTGPAVAHGVKHAVFAHNADKVDGKHAVKATAPISKRKGKLVATSRKSGLLPNNIIAKAPDAARLDGHAPTALRQLSIDAGAGVATGGAEAFFTGVSLPSTESNPGVAFAFALPDDYRAGTPIAIDATYGVTSNACAVVFSKTGWLSDPVTGENGFTSWAFPGGQTFHVAGAPADQDSVDAVTLTHPGAGVRPGSTLRLTFHRLSDNPADTCGSSVTLETFRVRY